jgi:hypothetical protein
MNNQKLIITIASNLARQEIYKIRSSFMLKNSINMRCIGNENDRMNSFAIIVRKMFLKKINFVDPIKYLPILEPPQI